MEIRMLDLKELGITDEMARSGIVHEFRSDGTMHKGHILHGGIERDCLFLRWSDPNPRNCHILDDKWSGTVEPIEGGVRLMLTRIEPNKPSISFDDQPPEEAVRYEIDFVPREPWPY